MRLITGLLVGSLLLTTACATSNTAPTFGDEIRGSGLGSLGADWDKADKAVRDAQSELKTANQHVERGDKLVREAEKTRKRGEDPIRKGEREKRDAERTIVNARADRARIEAKFNRLPTDAPIASETSR